MKKSNELPENKQIRIGKAYCQAKEIGQKLTYETLAKQHNCSYDQVRRYVKKYQNGEFGIIESGNTKKDLAKTFELYIDPEAADMIANQIEICEQQLKTTSELEISKRTELVADLTKLKIENERLIKIRNENDKVDFTRKFLFKFAKKLKPSITEEDTIRILREVRNGI